MTSDKKRREVAENLRSLGYGSRVHYKEEFFELLDETVMEPDTGYHEMNDVFGQLADLIDPDPQKRTCTNESASGKYFKCSECGAELMQVTPGWVALVSGMVNYCPNCGARVVDEEDNDD